MASSKPQTATQQPSKAEPETGASARPTPDASKKPIISDYASL